MIKIKYSKCCNYPIMKIKDKSGKYIKICMQCLSKIKNNPDYKRDLGLFAKHIECLKNSVNYDNEEYIKQLKPFIDSQIIKADEFFKELSKTEEGRKKIIEIKRIQRWPQKHENKTSS